MNSLSPLLQAAKDLLIDFPQRQGHINDIAEKAIQKNLNLSLDKETFSAKLGQALAAHVNGRADVFSRVPAKKDEKGKVLSYRKGVYRLKQTRSTKAEAIHVAPAVDTAYLGKAGEHAVMSELLFWGFNASLMAVDQGIDVVASKDGLYFHIQVKTSTLRADGRFAFGIKRSSFEGSNKSSTYYVFVMRGKNSNTYAVIPSVHIDTQVRLGIISGENTLPISIKSDEKGNSFFLNGKDNITPFINNFGIIR